MTKSFSSCYVLHSSKNRQFPIPLQHMRITATMKTMVQIVQGRLSRKKLAKYNVINIEWLCSKNKFAGRGMRRRGNSHCKQYISQYQCPHTIQEILKSRQIPIKLTQKLKRLEPTSRQNSTNNWNPDPFPTLFSKTTSSLDKRQVRIAYMDHAPYQTLKKKGHAQL